MINTAFPLHLKYPEEGYHRILISSLTEGLPLLTWSKKVAQWNSKLNGFCYLKKFTHKSRATIANVLGPFPKGEAVSRFKAFEHSDIKKIHIDSTAPHAYHYRWAHKRPLGPTYLERFDKAGLYGGKIHKKPLTAHQCALKMRLGLYTPRQVALARRLGLKWALNTERPKKPSDSPNWRINATPLEPNLTDRTCFKCREEGHIAHYCPIKNWNKNQDRTAEYGRPAPSTKPLSQRELFKWLCDNVNDPSTTEEEKQKFLDFLVENGLCAGEKIIAMARTLHIKTIYIVQGIKKLEIPVTVSSSKGTTKTPALVDSSTTENFIDHTTVKWLKLEMSPMDKPVTLRNIDGTLNWSGKITHYLDLIVSRGNKKLKECFFVSNLGED